MFPKSWFGSYSEVRGSNSRLVHLTIELCHGLYLLAFIWSFLHNPIIFVVLLLALPIDLIIYRVSVLKRLHHLAVPPSHVNTSFWQPLVSPRLYWRLLFEKGPSKSRGESIQVGH